MVNVVSKSQKVVIDSKVWTAMAYKTFARNVLQDSSRQMFLCRKVRLILKLTHENWCPELVLIQS